MRVILILSLCILALIAPRISQAQAWVADYYNLPPYITCEQVKELESYYSQCQYGAADVVKLLAPGATNAIEIVDHGGELAAMALFYQTRCTSFIGMLGLLANEMGCSH